MPLPEFTAPIENENWWQEYYQTKPWYCYFCFQGTDPKTGLPEVPKPVVALAVQLVREGPYAKPAHPICQDCLDRKAYLEVGRCSCCGKSKDITFTANNSTTSNWATFRLNGEYISLCNECKRLPEELIVNNFDSRMLLTDHQIEILKRVWLLPDWKQRMVIPKLWRSIYDEFCC